MASASAAKAFEAQTKNPALNGNSAVSLIADTPVAVPARCQRRWYDWSRIQMDMSNTALYSDGKFGKAPFTQHQAKLLARERFLLMVQCIESKAGKEPTNPYLYPQ